MATVPARGQTLAPCVETTTTICPFADKDSQIPRNYNGPLFKLRRDYPTKVGPASEFPWRAAIHDEPALAADVALPLTEAAAQLRPCAGGQVAGDRTWITRLAINSLVLAA